MSEIYAEFHLQDGIERHMPGSKLPSQLHPLLSPGHSNIIKITHVAEETFDRLLDYLNTKDLPAEEQAKPIIQAAEDLGLKKEALKLSHLFSQRKER